MKNSGRDAIRLTLQTRRRDLDEVDQARGSKAVAEPIAKMVGLRRESGGVVASYIPFRGEIDPSFGTELLREAGWSILLPVCGDDGHMEFCPWSAGEPLVENRFGIGEPTTEAIPIDQIDAVIVPGLAFDRQGNRLGHGVGFYDRFFDRCAQQSHDPYRLGLAYDFQVVELPAPEPWDIPMHIVISPSEVIDTTLCE